MANGALRARGGLIAPPERERMLRPHQHGLRASVVALPAGPWRTVLEFLVARFARISQAQWAARMVSGEITFEHGEMITAHTLYAAGKRVFYFRRVDDEPRIPFDARILYQDEFIVVADKPHFLPVVPGGRFARETLLTRLTHALGIETLAPMHRIDRDTAGLVLFTVQPHTRNAYQRLFRERAVEKQYEAIAPFRIELALPLMRTSRLVESGAFMKMHEVAGAPNAQTYVDLIERRGDLARYALRPLTGQKHQLRAHMGALGAPILNDRIYPDLLPAATPDDWSRPLQLLAQRVTFSDPITGARRDFVSAQALAW